MAEDGEKNSTVFDRVLAAFLFHKAKDNGLQRKVTQGLVSGHTLHTDTNTPLIALGEPVGSLIRDEARKVYNAATNLKSKSGQVDLNAAGTGMRLQGVAGQVDKIVSSKIYRNLPKVKARRILKAGWDKLED